MKQYLDRFKNINIRESINNIDTRNVIIILSILLLILVFISFMFNRGGNEIEVIVENEEYIITRNRIDNSYRVSLNGEVQDPATLVDKINEQINNRLTPEQQKRVVWDLPGTLMVKDDTSEYDLEGKTLDELKQEDLKRQQDFIDGTFHPEE